MYYTFYCIINAYMLKLRYLFISIIKAAKKKFMNCAINLTLKEIELYVNLNI